ncbi:hypothetical protein [Deinococcus marmoris]|uniref:hypothetical protein n=1 Tax=Deinococcus marmoris TaxID=249408 RepID=UPI000496917A|nr:hypothetical protein [Deinococcus marmoris]
MSQDRPVIVCLCGSVRFLKEFDAASLAETLAGRMVLSVGSHLRSDAEIFTGLTGEEKQAALERLAELHHRKIDLADEILVVNVGGYVGETTQTEIEYARGQGKRIRWLEPQKAGRGKP